MAGGPAAYFQHFAAPLSNRLDTAPQRMSTAYLQNAQITGFFEKCDEFEQGALLPCGGSVQPRRVLQFSRLDSKSC